MRFVHVCLLNLAARPLRSLLTALGIAVAVGSFIALVGTSRGFERACLQSLTGRKTHLVGVRTGAIDFLSASIDESLADRLREVEGVADVAGELLDVALLDPGYTVQASGWRRTEYLWQSLRLSAGTLPGPAQPDGVVLGHRVAETLAKKPGDHLAVRGQNLVVTGISERADLMSRTMLVMALPTMQKLMHRPGQVTFFCLRLRHPEDPSAVAAVKERLAARFGGLTFAETAEMIHNDHFIRLFRATTWSISRIAVLMGLVVILNTLLMSVTERTYDIGVLSAIGWQAGRILSMILIEGVLLAVVGSLVGSALGILGLRLMARLHTYLGLLVDREG